ncbi:MULTISPECIES: acyl-ACP--UDP-N-acetylglucosamine O-acyltransferase [Chromohalobacter]|uniref:Acyl-[acyl-carrier-protein]--UDP-N-acetylglucosamine O-acyltransferase n=1 Tax=Chromohalobacter israelensis (strain ATCC BAA-138 / DSM 3043 / CIP 106854 / NCIMB 13768 / 1H11) TaxID=290398 RepID=Q1R021_CHRI1|nr:MULTISPECIES: acyl-ACP--UDP-N-acetylglucosamine O-acyltransferase [Chromohalobacter]ABE57937.1 acyl-[acyl-carrier-protein]--UDP-N-acetylglucosamine O-acyltransferase [Chromohalobacter salexigens DSM 3043]MBZ5876075.1 acyl-ACP--UDP-N-acetylglucosamine O-acyltransferase [Chromohalobacter salexigens]MDF9433811.1 acyl-ACP--UDP-N-acetylglucosamine O-acyltransferase [Chromohalobacter israelensis]MDO0946941.1 acyl-ACP--UDP-N-acetylglucosamine O-acyltransferase [Chromohalobacter salexigens]NQY46912
MIHPTALVDPSARVSDDVDIGPFCVIGPEVEIGDGTVIGPHVVIKGPTRLGKRNRIFQFASVGEDCQDKKYAGEATRLEMGDDNVVREGVTLHRGTVQDKAVTTIGSRNLFMAYSHVGHDCVIGDDCILANQATLAGHVTLGNFAILGGLSAIHQFCHMGEHAMAGGGSIITKDVPAYVIVNGNPAQTHGLNLVGLKRRGFERDALRALGDAYRIVYRQGLTMEQAIERLENDFAVPEVETFLASLKTSQRGITR